MSMPAAAVTPAGWVRVSSGSTTARVGRSRAWLMPVLTCCESTSSTQTVVDSAPVPVVVGTAISGLSALTGAAYVQKSRLNRRLQARLPAPQNWQNFGRTTLAVCGESAETSQVFPLRIHSHRSGQHSVHLA